MTFEEALAMVEADMEAEGPQPYIDLAARYFSASADGTRAKPGPKSPAELAIMFGDPPPKTGSPASSVVAMLAESLVPNSNWLYHPRCMGHQVSPPLPAAVWSEVVAAALNQSLAVQEMSPALTAVEYGVVRWMAGLAGFTSSAGGVFTSGGTEATFTALLAARASALPNSWETGVAGASAVVVTSEYAHYSVARAVGELGLGAQNCLALPASAFRSSPQELSDELDRLAGNGRVVVAVVATAGTTTTGSFDNLEAIGHICAQRSVWLHVDGCHGASALLSSVHRRRLKGLELATSLSWDPHKMMLLPLSSSVVLAKDERLLEAAFSQRAPYLFHGDRTPGRLWDQGLRSFQCSRRADVLRLWVALHRYGTEAFGLFYDHLCETAMCFSAAVSGRAQFQLLNQPESNIVCFRHVGDGKRSEAELDGLNAWLRTELNASGLGWITTARLEGRQVLRVTVMNLRTRPEDCDAVLDTLAQLAARWQGSPLHC